MIRCLFVQVQRNARGLPVRKEHVIVGETIQIGRAAECKVLLPDPGVNLYHAAIRCGEDGKLYIFSQDSEGLFINESLIKQAECLPGTEVWIGPFKLLIEDNQADYDLVLSLGMSDMQDQLDGKRKRYPLNIGATGLSKRRVAFWSSLLVAVLFLWLPLIQSLPFTEGARLPLAFFEMWSLGQMSEGHRSLSAKCNACHAKPFVPVSDENCKGCHNTPAHLANSELHASAFKGMRCATCHPDHRGNKPLTRLDKQCVSCHGNIKKKNPKTEHPNIHDFSVDHPAFKLTLNIGHQRDEVRQVLQQEHLKITEKSGLKFSHQVHLSKKGVSTPEGDTVMKCADCHKLDEAGMRFQPISMEKSCQQSGCHALDFDPPVPERALPHGSMPKLMATLNEYYAKAAIDEMLAAGKTRRCGDEPTTGNNLLERALSCAKTKVTDNTEKLFRGKEGCVECHEVSASTDEPDMPWKIQQVNITRHWMRHALFPHNKHSTAPCTDCHDKEHSKTSADVAIPDIKKCRECHVGAKVIKGKVSNSCEDCHKFHQAEKPANPVIAE